MSSSSPARQPHPTAEKRLEAALMESHRNKKHQHGAATSNREVAAATAGGQTPATAMTTAGGVAPQQQQQGSGGGGDNDETNATAAAALDPQNFDAGVREAGTSELERPLGVDARGERSADGDDDYSRATVNATAHAGGLPAEGARMGMIKPQ